MVRKLITDNNLLELFATLADNLRSMYPLTFNEVRGRRRPEVLKYALGDERHWAGMEALYEVAKEQGFRSEFRLNKRRTARYSFVCAGNLFLTASRVHHPEESPRVSLFRNSLAILNRPTLFRMMGHSDANDRFAVLVHGCFESHPEQLGFLKLVLPGPKMRPIATLDILRYLAETPSAQSIIEERIKRSVKPRLRKVRKIQEE
ncbi:hypothetical protein [Fundidesulfovibrio butyratiphilus]